MLTDSSSPRCTVHRHAPNPAPLPASTSILRTPSGAPGPLFNLTPCSPDCIVDYACIVSDMGPGHNGTINGIKKKKKIRVRVRRPHEAGSVLGDLVLLRQPGDGMFVDPTSTFLTPGALDNHGNNTSDMMWSDSFRAWFLSTNTCVETQHT